MNSVSRYIAALTVLLASFVVATGASRASVPTNSWGLEPSTTSCVVSRSYGSPESPSLVGVKATPDGGMQIAIVRPVYLREVGQNEAEVVVGGKDR